MRTPFILLPLTFALACGGASDDKKTDDKVEASADKADKADNSAPADEKAEEKKDGPQTIKIDKLGLSADVPAGAEASDAVIGEGVMIQGPGLVITIEEASDSTPKTLADAKEEADMYTPENLKEETLDDGWAMTFDNKGGMGTNYWVQVRREIDGKTFWCTTTAAQVEQQTNALAACKSLKK